MTPPRDFFAQAERLARWAHVALGKDGRELLDILHEWRDNNGVPLSPWALAIVVAHIAPGTGVNHVGGQAAA